MTRNATPVHLHEDDGPDLIECPECLGECFPQRHAPYRACPRCNGTGVIDRNDIEDDSLSPLEEYRSEFKYGE